MSVMLAKEWVPEMSGSKKDNSKFKKPPKGWIASEKADGYRATFQYNENGEGVFLSRTGKEFKAPEWFLYSMPPQKLLKGMILDGELWAGRENFQKMGTVRKKVPVPEEWMDLQYFVYDITNIEPVFVERLKILKKIVKVTKERWVIRKKEVEYPFHNLACPLTFAEQKTVTSLEMMNEYYQSIIDNGGEGIMIKHPECKYETGRSSNLLKVKPCFDREAIIVGHTPGNGKYKGKLGGFECQPLINHDTYMTVNEDPGLKFTLSGMDDKVRNNYKKTHPVGTIITFECSGFTDKGLPRFGRYLRIRTDIVLKEKDSESRETLDKVILIFTKLGKYYKNKGDYHRQRSYFKVIPGLQNLMNDSDLIEEKLKDIPGLGKGSMSKIRDIIDTGTCADYSHIQKFEDKENMKEIFLKIHGVGPACAGKLLESGFESIEDLRNCDNIGEYLNDVQIKGLFYYEDINTRIPHKEIIDHEKFLKKTLNQLDSSADLTVAGSYRRKKETSGDIDVLITGPSKEIYEEFVQRLEKEGYLQETLAFGEKKFMGMSNIDRKNFKAPNRRIDIMYTSPEEYPFAILYFTGSADFNVKMRNELLERGFTLNEHGVKYTDKRKKMKHLFKTEKDIFDYFEFEYVEPQNR